MPPLEKPWARPKPKPKPKPEPSDRAVVPTLADTVACASHCTPSCAFYHLCATPPPPPPSPAATVHLRSSRLPFPLILLSASLLVLSLVLVLSIVLCRLLRRRRASRHGGPLPHQGNEEEHLPLPPGAGGDPGDADGGVHHVWYIRTVGLDERAIAAITALVYDGKKCAAAASGDGNCAVCLAEFRNGETLRLLPRCGHAFHRGCIDTWLRAHVNCPLCRAPVQVPDQAAAAAPAAAAAGSEPEANLGAVGSQHAEEDERDGFPGWAVRRVASMGALPEVSIRVLASNGDRNEVELSKIRRLMKLSGGLDASDVGVGRSVSFGAVSYLHLPARYGPSAAGDADEFAR